MRLRLVALSVLLVLGSAACESTQDKAARLRADGGAVLAARKGLEVRRVSRDVKVTRATILHDANGTAAVVELVNRAARPQVRVPIAIRLDARNGRRLFANDAPGLEPALVSLPLLRGRERGFWVHNQVVSASTPARMEVKVGVAASTAPGAVPRIALSGIRRDRDADGPLVTGIVRNRSKVTQRRLTIFCVGRRGGRVVAAGRAVVERLPAAGGPRRKPVRFTLFFIGDPTRARLAFDVPPVALK